jgi:hypothetical protein
MHDNHVSSPAAPPHPRIPCFYILILILFWFLELIIPAVTQLSKHVVKDATGENPINVTRHMFVLIKLKSQLTERRPTTFQNSNAVFIYYTLFCDNVIEFIVPGTVCGRALCTREHHLKVQAGSDHPLGQRGIHRMVRHSL